MTNSEILQASTRTADLFLADDESCAICHRDGGGAAFCHVYEEGRKVTLCSPACAEAWLHRPRAEAPPLFGYAR